MSARCDTSPLGAQLNQEPNPRALACCRPLIGRGPMARIRITEANSGCGTRRLVRVLLPLEEVMAGEIWERRNTRSGS